MESGSEPAHSPPPPASRSPWALIAIGVLIFAVAGGLAWTLLRTPVPIQEITDYLNRTQGSERVRFDLVRLGTATKTPDGIQVAVAATGHPVAALYEKTDTSEYLQKAYHLDPPATEDVRRLIADPQFPQRREYAAARPIPEDPYLATVLELKTPANAVFEFRGTVNGQRNGDVWSFSVVSGGYEGEGGPQGQVRSSFGETSYATSDTADKARLHRRVDALQAFAAQVDKIHENLESIHDAAVEHRRRVFLALIGPGQVYQGQAQEAGEPRPTPVYLEFTEVSGENEVTAFLRNDGSWHKARMFQGTWTSDDDFETPSLTLTSLPDQAVHNGGPFLENTQTWTLNLTMDPHGNLAGQNRLFSYSFRPLGPIQVAEAKERLEAEFRGAVSAMEPGTLYHGAATSRSSGSSEPILLRVTGRSESGETVEASIESPARSWKRPLRGTIGTNSRRSGGEPIRFHTTAAEAAEDAPTDSLLGDRDDLDIRLGLEQGVLTGGDESFTYRFEPSSEADLKRLAADRAERARRFMDILRNGIAYDGTLHEDQGFIGHARLEITRIDSQTGAISATVRSLVRSDAYRAFAGTCDAGGGSLVLAATGKGSFGRDSDFDVPFLKGPGPATLSLGLNGTSIAGRIEGNPHWTMEFAAGSFLATPTESAEPNGSPTVASVFPRFPSAPGAYLLAHGAWTPLPKNHGHVVAETIKPKSEAQLPTNLVAVVNEAVNEVERERAKKKVPYLEFDGKDPRPATSGASLVILFLGTELSKGAVEVVGAETTKDGTRRAEVRSESPANIRFVDEPLAAYVRRVGPGAVLLTTTDAPVPPGPYIVYGDDGYELTEE